MPDVLHTNLSILEVDEKILLDELMLDKQASALILFRVSDTIAAVEESKFNVLVARLKKLGHTPKFAT